MDRRRFLGIRSLGGGSREFSCEALYMRVIDSRVSGTTAELLARLESELAGVRELRLRDSAWLARATSWNRRSHRCSRRSARVEEGSSWRRSKV